MNYVVRFLRGLGLMLSALGAYYIVICVVVGALAQFFTLSQIAVTGSYAIIWLGLAGQIPYLTLLMFRPWGDDPITRSMVVKSTAILLLFLNGAIINVATGHVTTNAEANNNFWLVSSQTALKSLVLLGVWYQFKTLKQAVDEGRQKSSRE